MKPTTAVVAVTLNCNARCVMCDIWKNRMSDELRPEEFAALPASLRDINVSGGEPFLRGDLPEIIAVLRRACPRARLVLSTNGFQPDKAARLLAEIVRIAPRVALRVSLDGLAPTHDQVRGVPGGFERCKETLDRARALGVRDLGVGFTLLDRNTDDLPSLHDFAQQSDLELSVTVATDSPIYFGEDQSRHRPPPERLRDALAQHARREYRSASPKRWVRAWFERRLAEYVVSGKRPMPCDAGRGFFYLDSLGTVYACHIRSLEMGNLRERSFDEIWSGGAAATARAAAHSGHRRARGRRKGRRAPMRIAFIGQKGLPARWGGVEEHVEAIATRLAARGHRVSVYVRRWYSGDARSSYRGVARRPMPTLRGKGLDAGVHSLVCSLDAAMRRYDVVHYHAVGPALFSFLPRATGRRIVATIHGRDYLRPRWGAFARRALRLGEGMALRCGHRALVVSRDLARHYGERVEYLPNGIDRPGPAPAAEIRERFGLAGDDYVLSLGRLVPEKRVDELIRAFREAAPAGLRLVVAGDGPEQEALRAAADERVLFAGIVNGQLKQELLANAYAFATCSELEGLPLALLEAMAHGRACAASDIPPHRELLDAGRGLVGRPLAELFALSDGERERLGAAARAHVEREHDWERIVDRLEELYIAK